jgi:hypothetical protein
MMKAQNVVRDKTGNSLKTMVQTIKNTNKHEDLNLMFANHGKENRIYPLSTIEIIKHKRKITRSILKRCENSNVDLRFQLVEDIKCYIKMKINHLSISTDRAISWYHHYIQHPSRSCLKEIIRSMIYWKGL